MAKKKTGFTSFPIIKKSKGQFRVVFDGLNGEVLNTSERMHNLRDVEHNIALMRNMAPTQYDFDVVKTPVKKQNPKKAKSKKK